MRIYIVEYSQITSPWVRVWGEIILGGFKSQSDSVITSRKFNCILMGLIFSTVIVKHTLLILSY